MKVFQISSAIVFSLALFLIGCKGHQSIDNAAMQSSKTISTDSLKDHTAVVTQNPIDTNEPAFKKVKLVYIK